MKFKYFMISPRASPKPSTRERLVTQRPLIPLCSLKQKAAIKEQMSRRREKSKCKKRMMRSAIAPLSAGIAPLGATTHISVAGACSCIRVRGDIERYRQAVDRAKLRSSSFDLARAHPVHFTPGLPLSPRPSHARLLWRVVVWRAEILPLHLPLTAVSARFCKRRRR